MKKIYDAPRLIQQVVVQPEKFIAASTSTENKDNNEGWYEGGEIGGNDGDWGGSFDYDGF